MSDETNHYLIAIAIGPVQEFIAASRKARDLWAGSDLLSDLSRSVAESIIQPDPENHRPSGKHELIFPSRTSLDRNHAVANKLLISTTCEKPEDLAEFAHQALNHCLAVKWDDSRAPYRISDVRADLGLANRQIEHLVEWYAAWVRYHPEGSDDDARSYKNARRRVELLLAGRKHLRDFGPAFGIPGRPKSSLDPSRESVITSAQQKTPNVRRVLHLGENEVLDAVSLLKRFAGQERFVSTSRVAIDPFIRAIGNTSLGPNITIDNLCGYAETLNETDLCEKFDTRNPEPVGETDVPRQNPLHHYKQFPFDCQLFYEVSKQGTERQIDKWLDLVGTSITSEQELRMAAAKFCQIVSAQHDAVRAVFPELPAYYAVLLADGDRMGAAISKLGTEKHHQDFSTELGTFASTAGEIVQSFCGAMIYSGGDDVLAFLPLDTVLPCAERLRVAFKAIMSRALAKHPNVDLPTLSVGIAIGHYAEHLQVMLDRARHAEREAKKERDSLAVSFSARSGGGQQRIVSHAWEVDPLAMRWAKAIEFHRHDTFPDGAAYELEALHRAWSDTFLNVDGTPRTDNPAEIADALRKEVLRILKRKQPRNETKGIRDDLLLDVEDRLTWVKERNGPVRDLKDILGELQAFIHEVIIARRIARLLLDDRSLAITRYWNDDGQRVLLAPQQDLAVVGGAGS